MAGGPATATQKQVISSWFTARRTRKDIAYLIETRSAAYSLLEDDYASERGWDYGCDYEVIEKFRRPLGLAEMPPRRGSQAKGQADDRHVGSRTTRVKVAVVVSGLA